jgi:hypothetical protein
MEEKSLMTPRRFSILLLGVLLVPPPADKAFAEKPAQTVSKEQIQKLINQLADPQFEVRKEAHARLLKIGVAALPLLEQATEKSDDPEVIARAWGIIDQWASAGKVPALLCQLASQHAPIRAGAADQLGKLESKGQVALAALTKAIDDPAEYVRCSAQEALKKIQATLPLRLEVNVLAESVEVDTETVYRLDITNQGSSAIENVRMRAVVPDLFKLMEVESSMRNKVENGTIICEPISLDAKASRRMEVHVKALRPGETRFKVEISADEVPSPIVQDKATTINLPTPAQPPAPAQPAKN